MGWLACEPRDPSIFASPVLEIQALTTTPSFFFHADPGDQAQVLVLARLALCHLSRLQSPRCFLPAHWLASLLTPSQTHLLLINLSQAWCCDLHIFQWNISSKRKGVLSHKVSQIFVGKSWSHGLLSVKSQESLSGLTILPPLVFNGYIVFYLVGTQILIFLTYYC